MSVPVGGLVNCWTNELWKYHVNIAESHATCVLCACAFILINPVVLSHLVICYNTEQGVACLEL